MSDVFRVALIHDVFCGDDAEERLGERLAAVREGGADLAVLPELPLQPWCMAQETPSADDAETPGGRRHAVFSAAARVAEVGLVGGAIVIDPESGQRHNTALVFDRQGALVARYRKVHLPQEPGFWETAHYVPGAEPPQRIDAFTMPLGVQICSDVNRPAGTHQLAARGAELVIAPRATPIESYTRWRLVLRANAVTGSCYVVSVNRPSPEAGVSLGGASLVIAPDGEVLVESTDPVCVVELSRAVVARARQDYPGYLPWDAALYARGWRSVEDGGA